jgi:RNA polymerase sigma-32 factor
MARSSTILNGESGLARYFADIRRMPLLEPQEEFLLAKRWRERGDGDARDRLVASHLRLVAKIAADFRGYGLSAADIISESNIGLVQSVSRFDPDKGFRLATYAMWWIRASIQEYVLRSWSLVKIGTTAAQKKLIFNLRRAKSRIGALDDGDLRPEQVTTIADRLGVRADVVVEMNRRLGGDASLNVPLGVGGASSDWQDRLVDDAPSQERILIEAEESDSRRAALREALAVLDDQERRIFAARNLADEPATLEVLAREYGLSRERVRQIEARSFEKVRNSVRHRVATLEAPQSATVHQPRPSARGLRLRGTPVSTARPRISLSHVSSVTAAA